jgi:hypothetical protein
LKPIEDPVLAVTAKRALPPPKVDFEDFLLPEPKMEIPKPTVFAVIPPVGSKDFHPVFLQKVDICLKISPFRSVQAEAAQIGLKATALTQLLAIIAEDNNSITLFTEDEIDRLFAVVTTNIFREYQHFPSKVLFCDIPPPMADPAWPHLEIVYLILYRLQCLFPAHRLFNREFLLNMFNLLGTPDANERKEVIQFFKNYSPAHPHHYDLILSKLTSILRAHIETRDRPFDLLTSLSVMQNLFESTGELGARFERTIGFCVLPLLHDPFLDFFHFNLIDLLDLYVDERPDLVANVVKEIMTHWPQTNVTKMCILTLILIDYIPRLSDDDQRLYLPKVAKIWAENCTSPSPKLAEMTFSVFISSEFDDLMMNHCDIIMEAMIPGIVRAMKQHWEQSIRDRAVLVLVIMERLDPRVFKRVSGQAAMQMEMPQPKPQLAKWESVFEILEDSPDLDLKDRMGKMQKLFGV